MTPDTLGKRLETLEIRLMEQEATLARILQQGAHAEQRWIERCGILGASIVR